MPQDDSPPPSPPSPNATESELKLSRKREREVSVEPVTTPKATVESDPLLRDTRTPAKKNRRQLAPTNEEEDGGTRSSSDSGSPPISTSPRQEMKIKVRQISQGVEDLNWRKPSTPEAIEAEPAEYTPPPPVENQQQVQPEPQQAEGPTPIKADDETPPKSPADSQLSQSVSDLPYASASASVDNLTSDEPSRLRSDSDSGDKSLKRKFVERGTSQGPQENGDASKHSSEPLKRPRDDADKDDNPRETKRPSPPPEPKSPKKTSPPSPKVPKLGGFSAYASSSSPFASVKGQNIFSKPSSSSSFSSSPSPAPFSPDPNATPVKSVLGSVLGSKSDESSPSTSTPTAAKRTGFEAFASTTSPFASVTRSKSPVLGSASKLNRNKSPPRRAGSTNSNPFSSYAGGLHSFAAPMSKRPRAGSPNGSSRSSVERGTPNTLEGGSGGDSGAEEEEERYTSFGEKLRSTRDDDEGRSDDEQQKVKLTEQEVLTGEEEEETLTQVRGKLFTLANATQWKERGTGLLKLNVKREDGSGARLVMRKEAVYTLLLNITLFPGMKCIVNPQDPRYLRFSAIENGATVHYNLRVSNAKIAMDLLEEINANIPMA